MLKSKIAFLVSKLMAVVLIVSAMAVSAFAEGDVNTALTTGLTTASTSIMGSGLCHYESSS